MINLFLYGVSALMGWQFFNSRIPSLAHKSTSFRNWELNLTQDVILLWFVTFLSFWFCFNTEYNSVLVTVFALAYIARMPFLDVKQTYAINK